MPVPAPNFPAISVRRQERPGWLVPLAVLLAGWATCGLLLAATWDRQRLADQDRLVRFSLAAEAAVQQRISTYIEALHAGSAFIRASELVSRAEWHEFVGTLDLNRRYPGIRGIGVAYPVAASDLPAFLARVRSDGAPEFAVPEAEKGAPPATLLGVITYFDPLEANRVVVGADILRESARHEAALAARDAGVPRMTPRVARLRDPGKTMSSIIYLPVYRAGTHPQTLEEHRREHVAWVFAPIVLQDVLHDAMEGRRGRLRLAVFEGTQMSPHSLMYASDDQASAAEFERTSQLELAGQAVTLGWTRGPEFDLPILASQIWATAIGGLATILLAGLVYSLQTTGRRARALAEQLTHEMSVAHQHLERSLRLQGAVLDGTSHAVISTNPDGLITVFNRAAERMLGYSRDDVVGKTTPVIFHRTSEVEARAEELSLQLGERVVPGFGTFVAQAKRGRADEREWTYVRKDGSSLPVLLGITDLRDDAGNVTGFVGIAQDLTERKKSEISLQETEERLGRVLGHAECLVWEAKVALTPADWSWRMAVFPSGLYRRLLDGRNETPGAGLWYQFHVPDQAEMNQRARDAMERGLPGYVQEFRLVRPNGETTWLRESVAVTEEEPGHFWLIGVAIDITDRKRVEAALRASLQEVTKLQKALDAHAIVAVTDAEGRITYANDRFLSISQYRKEEVVGQTHRIVNSGTHPPEFFTEMWATITAGEIWRGEICNRAKNGELYWVAATIVPFLGDDGRPVEYISVRTEITQRKQLEQNLAIARDEALKASRLKSEFLAMMSHEIRTPMNAIIGMSTMLAEVPLPAEHADMVRIIANAAESLLSIINDILDFSRIEAGRLRLDEVEFDFGVVVRETVALLESKAQAKHLSLHLQMDALPSCQLLGDAGRVRQILLNLIGNAVKFTDVGEVAVTAGMVAEENDRVRVRMAVRDTGIGIPRDAQDRLFHPFVQVDGSATRRFGGTGLGLAITRQLAVAMGGQVGFESEAGQGSTFWVEFDFARRAARPAATASRHGTKRRPTLRLLVAEDNLANQRVALLLLRKLGHAAVVVANGAEALQQLATSRFDAVLMDCQMPVLDGYEATRRIRSGAVDGVDPHLHIIALTAYARAEDRQRCRDVGMDGYVSKPIRVAELVEALAAVPTSGDSAPDAPDAPAPAALDFEVVETTRRLPGATGPSLLPELVALYRAEEDARTQRLGALITARAGTESAEAVHAFGGNAASFGGVEVRRVALELEVAAREGRWADVERHWVELNEARRRLHAALQSMGIE